MALSLPFKKETARGEAYNDGYVKQRLEGEAHLSTPCAEMLISQGGCWHVSRSARYETMLLKSTE